MKIRGSFPEFQQKFSPQLLSRTPLGGWEEFKGLVLEIAEAPHGVKGGNRFGVAAHPWDGILPGLLIARSEVQRDEGLEIASLRSQWQHLPPL